jgi:hypothetical protein
VDYEYTYLPGGYEDASVFYESQSVVKKNGKMGIYYSGRGLVVDVKYEDITYCVNGASAVKDETGYYFIDRAGNKSGVLSSPVGSLSILANNMSAVSIEDSYGYVKKDLIVPNSLPYEYATPFSSNLAAVKAGGKWGIIRNDFTYLVEPLYDGIKLTEFGTCISGGVIFARQGDYYVMLNNKGEEIAPHRFEEVNTFLMSGQPAAVKLDGNWTFVKTTGELFTVEKSLYEAKSFNNYMAPVTLDGIHWGFMDGYGKMVIEPQFENCKQFSDYGVAPVKQGGLWTFIKLIRYQ